MEIWETRASAWGAGLRALDGDRGAYGVATSWVGAGHFSSKTYRGAARTANPARGQIYAPASEEKPMR